MFNELKYGRAYKIRGRTIPRPGQPGSFEKSDELKKLSRYAQGDVFFGKANDTG